jgi:hypothetical protein
VGDDAQQLQARRGDLRAMPKNKIVILLVVLLIGYVLGAKMPVLAQKIGVA